MGQTAESLTAEFREPAEQAVKVDLALRSVAELQGLVPDDDALDEYLEEMAARIPLQRIGQAADTAAMCAFLASDEASFITGEAINVSGGEEMH